MFLDHQNRVKKADVVASCCLIINVFFSLDSEHEEILPGVSV